MATLTKASFSLIHPIFQLFLIYLFAVAAQMLTQYVGRLFIQDVLLLNLIENCVGLLLSIYLLSYFCLWSDIYWFSKYHLKLFWVFLIPASYVLLNVDTVYSHSLYNLIIGGVNTLISACFEEFLCRLVAIHLLIRWLVLNESKRPALYSVLISALLFGLAHLANIVNQPQGVGAIIGQTVYAGFIGVGFAACYLVTRSILPLILIHAAINFMSFLTESGQAPDVFPNPQIENRFEVKSF